MSVAASLSANYSYQAQYSSNQDLSGKALIVEKTLSFELNYSDQTSISTPDLGKSLSISAQQILSKINELLEAKGFKKSEDLSPQDVSPEATSDRVVTGITALFDAFAKQNQDLNSEELVSKFVEEAKKGVDQGYSDAYETLKGLGAFGFEGVESSISKTKDLILEKLEKFGEFKLEQLNNSVGQQSSEITQNELLSSVKLN